jgi:hypothetical protein
MNWEEKYEDWKVDWLIEKSNMNRENWNNKLRRGIWTEKDRIINWEEKSDYWKVDWLIEKSNMNFKS